MRNEARESMTHRAWPMICALSLAPVGASLQAHDPSPPHAAQTNLERDFDASIDRDEMRQWLRQMSSEPNQVGSPHDKSNADWELAQFRRFGWDAHVETFDVVYPTPIEESVEILSSPAYRFTLQEPPISGDTSATGSQPALPAYLAYQGDGEVTAPVVYVNYGLEEDYAQLRRLGISVEGKIVLARYGGGFRGLKPRLAKDHGAVGCLIYSDPAGDGYGVESTYPSGPARPPQGTQRGTVLDITRWVGDPLKPDGVAAATRLTIAESPVIMKIPALPVSYADAQVLMKTLGGQVVPKEWRGALPLTYRAGPSAASVHLVVKSDWSAKTLYDVVAMIHGTSQRDEWVLRGNHRDGWVFGAEDPLSGQVALLEEAKAIGQLVRSGWHPRRTLVYLSWDGEEAGLMGSTEWASAHTAELKEKAVIYINSDNNDHGFLRAGGSADLDHLVNEVANDVMDPETQVSIAQRLRAKMEVDGAAKGASEEAKTNATLALNPSHDFPIQALGSGSDFSVYLEHLGIASLNIEFGEEGGGSFGVYHSRYDTFEHYDRFGDPGFAYSAVLAKFVGHLILHTADADLPLQRTTNFAEEVRRYLEAAKTLEANQRSASTTQARMLANNAFQLAADPNLPSGNPQMLSAVPPIDFTAMDGAVSGLEASAQAYDAAFAKNAASLEPGARTRLRLLMLTIDQTLAPAQGLPGRTWFKNLIYAPGRYTGYEVRTLPGITEAIEEERWADVDAYVQLTADALNAYSERLKEATALLTAGLNAARAASRSNPIIGFFCAFGLLA